MDTKQWIAAIIAAVVSMYVWGYLMTHTTYLDHRSLVQMVGNLSRVVLPGIVAIVLLLKWDEK